MPEANPWIYKKSLLTIALEVVLISAGVFLGLAGDQWMENSRNRDLAENALRRFHSEFVANRHAITEVSDYHKTQLDKLKIYFAADAKTRETMDLGFSGLRPPFLGDAAWDLALATQSLAHIDHDLAFTISTIYRTQQEIMELASAMTEAMFIRPPQVDGEAFLRSVENYYGDLIFFEPELVKMYDQALPQIERALGEAPTETKTSEVSQ